MKNLFDAESYPTEEPSELVAGGRWVWTRPDVTEAYPTAQYTLVYTLALMSAPHTSHTVTAAKVGGAHVVEVASTIGYAAGEYTVTASVRRDSDSATVIIGTSLLTVKAAGALSYNYRVLQAINATIEGTANNDQLRVEIAGRALWKRPMEELLMLQKEFQKRWNTEKSKIERKNGRLGRRVLVGMSA